ncbi:MAG: 50S ribosomal protein L11 methyltransferase [Candidatus Competibacteraceae bacterium]|nr:50S ribosomal protein L11 methyltransferase [Candidatus Competibacteraceae bacterium]
MMNWTAVTLILQSADGITEEEISEIITAEVMHLPIDGIWQQEGRLTLYFPPGILLPDHIALMHSIPFIKEISLEDIAQQNWNKLWEASYQPVEIPFLLRIRAVFHSPNPLYQHELIIQPNMSFGTGHHATTRMMLETLIEHPPVALKVLDMGCGTSILAILAEKLGAQSVHAVDNDPLCIENSKENLSLNQCRAITVSTLSSFQPNLPYNLILANIQRQILIEQLPFYESITLPGSQLWLSGIELADKDLLVNTAKACNFKLVKETSLSSWLLLLFEKY